MSSLGFTKWKMCSRKTRFSTESGARERGLTVGLRAYECPFCEGYHLTKAPNPAVVSKPYLKVAGGVASLSAEIRRVVAAISELDRKGVRGDLRERAETRLLELRSKIAYSESFDRAEEARTRTKVKTA